MQKFFFLIVLFIFSSSFSYTTNNEPSIPFHINPNGDEYIEGINNDFESRLLQLINERRRKRGLVPLELHDDLMRASRYHAADMANENYHEHATYNRGKYGLQVGMSTFKRISKFYDGFANTENIAAGYGSPEHVLIGWMQSPGHRKNLFNKSATHMGVGYYHNTQSEYGHYWVFESAVQ
jgi:uncharacterized protein YkwD